MTTFKTKTVTRLPIDLVGGFFIACIQSLNAHARVTVFCDNLEHGEKISKNLPGA